MSIDEFYHIFNMTNEERNLLECVEPKRGYIGLTRSGGIVSPFVETVHPVFKWDGVLVDTSEAKTWTNTGKKSYAVEGYPSPNEPLDIVAIANLKEFMKLLTRGERYE